jgi:dephospho-CoA kinase
MTKIIGLTGGIGSGKTTVAGYFRAKGIPVYIADEQARKLTDLPETLKLINDAFGESVIENSSLNRQKLAQIVFTDKKKLEQLNGIIHPIVNRDFESWLSKFTDAPFIIKEAAILFETGNHKKCDYVITVTAPLEDRINRVLKRDNTTRELIINRINNQWSDEKLTSKSDFVIKNTDPAFAKEQVEKILKKLSNP